MQTRAKNWIRATTTATATLTATGNVKRARGLILCHPAFWYISLLSLQDMKLSNATFYRRQDELFFLFVNMDVLGLENISQAN